MLLRCVLMPHKLTVPLAIPASCSAPLLQLELASFVRVGLFSTPPEKWNLSVDAGEFIFCSLSKNVIFLKHPSILKLFFIMSGSSLSDVFAILFCNHAGRSVPEGGLHTNVPLTQQTSRQRSLDLTIPLS